MPLVYGQQYIFGFSMDAANGNWATGATPYDGGGVYLYYGSDPIGPWSDVYAANYDLSFSADLSGTAVPEPGSIVLLGSGLIGLGAIKFRRRGRLV
jgi:hypothetical protein